MICLLALLLQTSPFSTVSPKGHHTDKWSHAVIAGVNANKWHSYSINKEKGVGHEVIVVGYWTWDLRILFCSKWSSAKVRSCAFSLLQIMKFSSGSSNFFTVILIANCSYYVLSTGILKSVVSLYIFLLYAVARSWKYLNYYFVSLGN